MRNVVEIEDIEQRRLRAGIDDVELRSEIRGLQVGDFVKLTFLTGPSSSETLSVRITSISGSAFRGKLADGPVALTLSKLRGRVARRLHRGAHPLPRQAGGGPWRVKTRRRPRGSPRALSLAGRARWRRISRSATVCASHRSG